LRGAPRQAEVFAMNNMFVAALLLLVVQYQQTRRLRFAVLGAFTIGLGLSNQHTLLMYALPLVAWMLAVARGQLLAPGTFALLCLAGLLGLSPYAYLPIAGRHAGCVRPHPPLTETQTQTKKTPASAPNGQGPTVITLCRSLLLALLPFPLRAAPR